MGFSCGLVGLPNAGKSTIFNAMTNLGVEASAYPFCTIKPHVGTVALEDDRLDHIQRIVGSVKKTHTVLEFVDIAGLVKGASQGEGLGNQFLSHIGGVDAVAHIVRCFEDANVSHPYEGLDPVRDAQIVTQELILKDLEIVEQRLAKARAAARSGSARPRQECIALEELFNHLIKGNTIRRMKYDPVQSALVREMNLLTAKPVIFIANVDETHLHDSSLVSALSDHTTSCGALCIPFCGKVQAEISELDQTDQLEFLQAMGLNETGLQKIVKAGFRILDLITFFTANTNEARAWAIPGGTHADKAAGKIHSDFEENFIKAEVIKIADLMAHGSVKTLHNLGLAAIHGRDYIVEDGDLILFRIGK